MYFPYLRGKQFELLALRELCSVMGENREKISPIIEPVKNTSGLINCITELRKNQINFNVIINPSVGEMKGRSLEILTKLRWKLPDYDNFQLAVIVDHSVDYRELLENVLAAEFEAPRFSFIHNETEVDIGHIQERFSVAGPIVNNVINLKRAGFRYHRAFEMGTRVSLYDYFGSLPKNADYLHQQDSNFSDEYKFYKDEGFSGFGDFLTIGDIYMDSGRLPWAVAVHISYVDEQGRIRVKHFVSDTNDDPTDVAGKFSQANAKLVAWANNQNVNTIAVNRFRELQAAGHYPGLGTIKKLSIMNHIELMLSLI